MNISAIVPVYNEESRIEKCIKQSLAFWNKSGFNYELVFASEPCTDKTLDIIKKYQKKNKRIKLIVNKKKEGKGYSVKQGVLNAKHNNTLFYDVDLSVPLIEINKFVPFIDKYDVIIGSRLAEGAEVERKLIRKFLTYGLYLLRKIMFNMKIKDSQCGFKYFNKKACSASFKKMKTKDEFFDIEILYLLQRAGKTIKEVPVVWIEDNETKFNAAKAVVKFFKRLVLLRLGKL